LGKRWISLENVGLKPNKHLGQPVNDGWFTGKLWGLMQKKQIDQLATINNRDRTNTNIQK
jgi:hypothetical protein